MKIGIITFHFAHNQGAVLQCYALQNALNKMGYDAGVIDYCPSYHTIRYSAKRNPFVMAYYSFKKQKNKGCIIRFYQTARAFAKGVYLTAMQTYKLREKNFSNFINKNLNLSDSYKTIKSLRKNPPKYDAYISGSDQLWNPDLVDGTFDPAYFLDFGESDVKKITYAVSLKENYTEKEKQKMQQFCKAIDAISAREKNNTLDEVLNGEYTVCIDPTLLLSMEDYADIISEKAEDKPYVFVYGFESTDNMINAVKSISNELGIRVVNGSPERVKLSNAENLYDYGPDEFLSYIKNAQFVVTNSFHGTAFSIIYNKQFVTVAHTTRGRRMVDLLEKLGLSDRLWQNSKCNWKCEINYSDVNEKRAVLKEQSLNYLRKNLNDKNR